MKIVLSSLNSVFLLAAVMGAVLSAVSYLKWCVFEGCLSLQGIEVYGVPVSAWGVVFFAVIVFLTVIPRLGGAGIVRTALLGAGVGVEVILIHTQWLLSEWCAVCLAVAFVLLFLCILDAARLIKARIRREIGRLGLIVSILLALAGAAAGFYAAQPVAAEFMPQEGYDKEQVHKELEKIPHIGKDDEWPVVRIYSDYLCPYCQKKEPMLNEIIHEYMDRARFYFCDLPIHGEASQFYMTMFLACLIADNDDAQILAAREMLFEYADQEVGVAKEIIEALIEQGIEMKTESDPIKVVYAANIAVAGLDGVTSTPTVVVESRPGRRIILKGRFEKEELDEAIRKMDW